MYYHQTVSVMVFVQSVHMYQPTYDLGRRKRSHLYDTVLSSIPVLSTLSSTATPSASQPKLIDIVHETIHDNSNLPTWSWILIGIGALSMFVCVILCICRTRICERKNSPLEKASLLGNYYTEKVHEQIECVIENEEKRPEPECAVEEEGKGLESKPIQPDCIIENEEKKSVEKKGNLGEVCVSLVFQPTTDKLTVGIFAARNVKKMDLIGKSDPYVKLSLYKEKKRLKKKKTTVKKCSLNPVYHESFTFKVPSKKIGEHSLVVSVVNYDRFKPSEPIGQFVLGSSATGDGIKHWGTMLSKPRKQISQWHALQAIKDLSNG